MNFERSETQDSKNYENKTFECPTGTFTIEYGEVDEEGEPTIKDIVFRQERDIDGTDLEEEVSISLGEYLPEGWTFEERGMFGFSPDSNKVRFPEGGLELNKSLTVMLHELGHANSYEHHREKGTSEEYVKKDNGALRERDAWAYALGKIRSLMKQGIIAEEAWRDRKTLTDLMYTALSSGRRGKDKRYTKGKKFEQSNVENIEAVDDAQFDENLAAILEMQREFREKWGR